MNNLLSLRKKLGLNQSDFAEVLGLGRSAYTLIENGRNELTPRNRKALEEEFNVHPDYLDGKDVPMFLDAASTINTDGVGAPYYNVDFIGGFDLVFDNGTTNPEYFLDIPPYNKPGIIWCNLYGKSMEPYILSGDKIAIKEVFVDDIIFGKCYGISTKAGLRTVKWVVRSPVKGCVRLIPENKDEKFGDYQDLETDKILRIFLLMGAVRAF